MTTSEREGDRALAEASYRFCDVVLSLRAARLFVIHDFDTLYGAFRQSPVPGQPDVTCLIDTDESGRGHVLTGRSRREVTMPDPGSAYASWIVFEAAAAASRTHLFFHAAAVCLGDRALLLAGPTGRGKSTLATAMADVGAEPLNDDITPVERASGIAEHFPKGQPETEVQVERRRPVSAVIFLGPTTPVGELHLAVDRLPERWRTQPPWGAEEQVLVREHPGYWEIRRPSAPPGAVELLRAACEAAGVTILRDLAGPEPFFRRIPELQPVAPALAAPRLAAELFGRQNQPATDLAWALMAAFSQATFWQLIPGPPDATAQALMRAIRQPNA